MTSDLGFGELGKRLVRHLNELVRRGVLTERRLASLTQFSQPHIHNVLKGARGLTADLADQVLSELNLDVRALFTQDELHGLAPAPASRSLPLRQLAGRLGGGAPYPQHETRSIYSLPASFLAQLVAPVAAVIHEEEHAMWPTIWPHDTVVLDRSPQVRRRPSFDDVYALDWQGHGLIARCQRVVDKLVVVTDDPDQSSQMQGPISLAGRSILDIVRGKVAWLGRELDGY